MMRWMFAAGFLALALGVAVWLSGPKPLAQTQTPEALPSGRNISVLISRQLGAGSFDQQYPFWGLELTALNGPVSVRGGPARDALSEVFALQPGQAVRFEVQAGGIVAQLEGKTYPLGAVAQLEAHRGESRQAAGNDGPQPGASSSLEADRRESSRAVGDDEPQPGASSSLEGSAPEGARRVRFRLLSSTRGLEGRNPEYPGALWLTVRGGAVLLVNTLDFQDYLKRVLPSEVPPSFHPEAIRAQAVAARTYALSRQQAESFWKQFGADVDDSVSEQVYNNQPTNPVTDAAVDATRNQVLTFEGQPIQTFFFSTSPGSTANIQEVWPDRAAVPYLVAKNQTDPPEVRIENETQALEFFRSRNSAGFYDSASSLWRWRVRLSRAELEAILGKTLPSVARNSPQFVGNPEGSFAPDAPEFRLGTLRGLKVIKRTAGGFVTELEIQTSTGRYSVGRESNVRNLIRPNAAFTGGPDVLLERFTGEPRVNFPALPSAAFALETQRDSAGNLQAVTFWGGGFGHGVGMSQFGADGLGRQGKSYAEILEHFYPGTKLEELR
ncbi:MAG: SpoIID/LytB domain-containing protein [Meiothermus sp.]|nr:SpoIID/LytB domain-containing protein [Meiothermus sp.]